MSKVKLTAEEKQIVAEKMKTIMLMGEAERGNFMAMTIGDVYDNELPIDPVLEAIAQFKRAGNRPDDNHVYYMTPISIDKKVFTLTSNCNVTQVQKTPNSRTELTLVPIVTEDIWVCLTDFTKGDHDALQTYADTFNEAMDRYEIKNVLALLDAAAVAEGNVHTLESGKTAYDYEQFIEQLRSIQKYGNEFVLIAGANVYSDLLLMDLNQNTFREYGMDKIKGMAKVLKIEDLTVDINGSGQEDVLDPDVAYLVATSDSKKNRPVLVARRSLDITLDKADTRPAPKDRIIVDQGNKMNVGATVKLARGQLMYEEFGAVILNSKVVSKFTRS